MQQVRSAASIRRHGHVWTAWEYYINTDMMGYSSLLQYKDCLVCGKRKTRWA